MTSSDRIDHEGGGEENNAMRDQIADTFVNHRQFALELLGFIVNEGFNNALTKRMKLIELINIILVIRFLDIIVFFSDLLTH